MVDEETNRSYPFGNGLSGLNGLNGRANLWQTDKNVLAKK
jgi:hypothetical protein